VPRGKKASRPNLLVILIDHQRYDEFGAGGHPYLETPHVDRLAREGALFERAFHTTPICSPNRASIVTGQYASRHGIIDNVARDAMSHRLPNYPRAAAPRLRDGAPRQVAHGQRRQAAAGL
jgi:N-acetylglucosamine-6-sulfatase